MAYKIENVIKNLIFSTITRQIYLERACHNFKSTGLAASESLRKTREHSFKVLEADYSNTIPNFRRILINVCALNCLKFTSRSNKTKNNNR